MPILFLPHGFEQEFSRHLIGLYEAHGGQESGVTRVEAAPRWCRYFSVPLASRRLARHERPSHAFLPFLYDDEAAKIREYNNKFLGEGVDAYIDVEAAPPAQKPAGRDHRGPTVVSVATLGARLGLARPGDPAATRATTTDRAENHVRRMQQSLRTHEHAAGLGAPGRAPSTKGSSRQIRLVFAPTWRSAHVRPPVALIRLPMRSSGCPANGGRAYGARTCNALYTPASAMGCRGG